MKNSTFIRSLIVMILVVFMTAFSSAVQSQNAEKVGRLFEKLSWREIGPAVMGGRTVDIDVVEKKPWIIYAAVGPSGVWKSENNGITWKPVFHKEKTVSVGDLAVSQSHPEIVWIGTGEATCRNSVTIGDGVYKSIDGGKTWKNMGLEETRHISRIIINPGDPNIVYVSAMGHLWGPNDERGIYKTMDGGKTWKKILFVDENTGFADLAMDPSDSLVLYAAAYEHRRLPYYFSSGGPGSGLYKTTDGGETWQKLIEGLPEGIMGRIGLAVSRSNPNVVYALIEHKEGGIWRSEDKGKTWKRMCDTETYKKVNSRPFYYSQIRVDPSDDKVVYVFSVGSYVSKDMGKKFKIISTGTHSDHHALWIDPSNPRHLIDGNDGGIDITYDGGKHWYNVQNIPAAEVYRIGFDMRDPYYVYCGLQDNGSWGGPSSSVDLAGITNDDWYKIGGGDGFSPRVDPADPNTIYSNYQMNGLYRYNLNIRRSKSVRPAASLKEPPYRFNWNSPIHISPHDPKTVYTGGNYLFKTEDGGHSWHAISPDLTTNDPAKQKDSGGPITPDNTGAESHCTIYTISESPVERGVIWCGTDDGNVQLTRNGGKTWKNTTRNIPGLPRNTWCSSIEASHFGKGTAYASFDGHRHDDYRTYVYKTTDYGKTWKSIKGNLPFGWVHVIREDLRNKNLLFLGTEFGIYASLDRGKSWFSLKNNMPTVAVRDIAIHPRENDLIIGTHGRGIWILDDISPLQEMTEKVLKSDFYLFNIRLAKTFLQSSKRESFSSAGFAGKNPPYGSMVTVYLREKAKEKPKVLFRDKNGDIVYTISLSNKSGLQRITWNFQYVPITKEGKKIKPGGTSFFSLPLAFPGEYAAELAVGEEKMVRTAVIQPDPRFHFSEEERILQRDALARVISLSKRMGLCVTSTKSVGKQFEKLRQEIIKEKNVDKEVRLSLENFEKEFKKLEEMIIPKRFVFRASREESLRGGTIQQRITTLGASIGGYPSAPTETDLFLLDELSETLGNMFSKLNEFIERDIPELNRILKEHELKTLKAPKKIEL